jgi:hypothetical protein
MPPLVRQSAVRTVLLASIAYVAVGVATAALAGAASSSAGVKGWRLTAWLVSLAVFSIHLAIERYRHVPHSSAALRVALAVALGAFGVAALGPLRSHWGEPQLVKMAALSLVLWPVLTGVPAFGVALVGGHVVDRLTGRTRTPSVRRA